MLKLKTAHTSLFPRFQPDTYGKETDALISEYLAEARELALAGCGDDWGVGIRHWQQRNPLEFLVFHTTFLDNQIAKGRDLKALFTFCLTFMLHYSFSSLDRYYEQLVKRMPLTMPTILVIGGYLPLVPLLDVRAIDIPPLLSQMHHNSQRQYRNTDLPSGISPYQKRCLEMFGEVEKPSYTPAFLKHMLAIKKGLDPRERDGANLGGDPALLDLFVAVFKGHKDCGVSLKATSRYLIHDILNCGDFGSNTLDVCLGIVFYPIGLLCHLQGMGYDQLAQRLETVMGEVVEALHLDAFKGDLLRGAMINLLYFDAAMLKRLQVSHAEISGQAVEPNAESSQNLKNTLGGPLAWISHQNDSDLQSLLPYHLKCLESAGHTVSFDDVAGGAAMPEIQAKLLSMAGGCTPGLKAILNEQKIVKNFLFTSLQRAIDYEALTDAEAAFFIAHIFIAQAIQMEYEQKFRRSGLTNYYGFHAEPINKRLTPETREMTILRLAATGHINAHTSKLLGLTGADLKATDHPFADELWEYTLSGDLGL